MPVYVCFWQRAFYTLGHKLCAKGSLLLPSASIFSRWFDNLLAQYHILIIIPMSEHAFAVSYFTGGPLILAYRAETPRKPITFYAYTCIGKSYIIYACSFLRGIDSERNNGAARSDFVTMCVCTHNDNLAKSSSGVALLTI